MSANFVADWYPLILEHVNPTGKEFGSGAYGRVFEVDYEGTLFAAKEAHPLLLHYARQREGTLKTLEDNFLRECHIWSMTRHPSIVHFIGRFSIQVGLLSIHMQVYISPKVIFVSDAQVEIVGFYAIKCNGVYL